MARRGPHRLRRARTVPSARIRSRSNPMRSCATCSAPSSTSARSGPWCSRVRAAISARAGMCTRSSARSTRMSMPELLDFTRMTGDLVRAIRACPQIVDCGGRRRLCGRRRDHRHGLGHPHRRRRGAHRLSVHAGGARRLRHGRLRHPAAAIGQGRAAELLYHRPIHECRGGTGMGLLQPDRGCAIS